MFYRNDIRNVILVFVVMAVSVGGSASGQVNFVTVTIDSVGGAVGTTVEVPVTIVSTNVDAAAVSMEIVFDSTVLQFVGVRLGDAPPILAMVDFNADPPLPPGTVLVVVATLALEANIISDGVLVFLSFDVLSADAGLIIPLEFGAMTDVADSGEESLVAVLVDGRIDLTCVAPSPPMNVAASDGDPEGVFVEWDAVAGAVEYRVFRGEVNNPFSAAPLGDWQMGTMLLDDTAGAPMIMTGCFGEPLMVNEEFFYWVVARSQVDCESDFGGPDVGFRGADTMMEGAGILRVGGRFLDLAWMALALGVCWARGVFRERSLLFSVGVGASRGTTRLGSKKKVI